LKTFGGSEDDNLKSIISTADGGFIIAGSSRSDISDDKTDSNRGCEDFWIIKINSLGIKIWDKTFGGNHCETLESMISTEDGGFIIVGSSNSDISGEVTEINNGGSDFWVIKFNSLGQKKWERMYGGSKNDDAKSIVATSDRGFIIVGMSKSDISGDKTEESKDYNKSKSGDYWAVKINLNGDKVWDKTYGGGSIDYPKSIIATSDGNYIITGMSQSDISGEKTEANKGYGDYWVVKIDIYGQKIWDKTYGGNYSDAATAMIQTPDDGGIIIGSSNSNNFDGKLENYTEGTLMIKINNKGEKIWSNKLDGINKYNLESIISTLDGGFLMTGYSYKNETVNGVKEDFQDYLKVKINDSGEKIWEKAVGGNNHERAKSIIELSDGNILIVGTSSSDISGDKSEKSRGGTDYWLVKLGFQ
jgi:hypothetical protein